LTVPTFTPPTMTSFPLTSRAAFSNAR
jgi:hypothetical protein